MMQTQTQLQATMLDQAFIRLQLERKAVLYKRVIQLFYHHAKNIDHQSEDKLILGMNAFGLALPAIDLTLQSDPDASNASELLTKNMLNDALIYQTEFDNIHSELSHQFFAILTKQSPPDLAFKSKHKSSMELTRSTLDSIMLGRGEEDQRTQKFQANPQLEIEKYHDHALYHPKSYPIPHPVDDDIHDDDNSHPDPIPYLNTSARCPAKDL